MVLFFTIDLIIMAWLLGLLLKKTGNKVLISLNQWLAVPVVCVVLYFLVRGAEQWGPTWYAIVAFGPIILGAVVGAWRYTQHWLKNRSTPQEK